MRISVKVPTSASEGVPDSVPLAESKFAHAGVFSILNVNASPSGSDAVGVKEYASPTMTAARGLPLIVGALLVLPPGPGLGLRALVSLPFSLRQPVKVRDAASATKTEDFKRQGNHEIPELSRLKVAPGSPAALDNSVDR